MRSLRGCKLMAVAAVTLGIAMSSSAQDGGRDEDLLHLDLDELVSVPVVEIASKRSQSQYHAPAFVTVLDRDDIARLSVDSIPDVLRRVPGAFVMQTDAGVYHIGLRGLNQLNNNRVLVLVDGRVMRDLSAESVTWTAMPISLEDVERIEILHGPGAVMYGPNALSGVIHIKTKRPLSETTADAHTKIEATAKSGIYALEVGDPGVKRDWRMQHGSSAQTALSWANENRDFGVRSSFGVGGLPMWQQPDELSAQSGFFDYRARVTAQYAPSPRTDATLSLSHQHSEATESVGTLTGIRPYRHRTQAFNFHLHREGVGIDKLSTELQLDGQRRRDRSSGPMMTSDPGELYLRGMSLWHLAIDEGLDTLSLGVEGFVQQVSDFGNSEPFGLYGAVLGQNELRLWREPLLLFTIGLRAEQVRFSQRDVAVTYDQLNPSGALVLDIEHRHNLRLVGATGRRNPSGFERFADFDRYPYGNDEAPFRPLVSNPSLKPTRAINLELGYSGLLSPKLQVFSNVYAQRIEDLAGVSTRVELPLQFVNLRDVDMVGTELGGKFAWNQRGHVWAHYAFNYSRDADSHKRLRDWPAHLGQVGVDVPLGARDRVASEVSGWASILPDVLSREGDLVVRPQESRPQVLWNLHLGHSMFEGNGELFLAGRNLLALFRDPDDTRQYVSTHVQPIGASVILGARISEGL